MSTYIQSGTVPTETGPTPDLPASGPAGRHQTRSRCPCRSKRCRFYASSS